MIGPFSTTLVPLSSSSSVDRQVLINVEASAISPDERTFGFIFTQIPVHKAFGWRKKIIKELGPEPVLSVCLRPPNIFLAPAATAQQIEQTSPNASCWKKTLIISQLFSPEKITPVISHLPLNSVSNCSDLPKTVIKSRRSHYELNISHQMIRAALV